MFTGLDFYIKHHFLHLLVGNVGCALTGSRLHIESVLVRGINKGFFKISTIIWVCFLIWPSL